MKCELAQQKIAIFTYGELPDDQSDALEQHLSSCAQCRAEFESLRVLRQAMTLAPFQQPSANLLTNSRLRLEEALDSIPPRGWLLRATHSVLGAFAVLSHAPVAVSSLLLLGIGLGVFSGYQIAQRNNSQPARLLMPAAAADLPLRVAAVSGIYHEPNSDNVEVRYDRLIPQTSEGSLDDPQIRQLLLIGAENQANPGVQQDSVNLLADECRVGHECSAGPVRKALLVALRYDRNPEARLEALEGLQPYVAEDMRVRDAVLETLMSDQDPEVRSRAIELLEPVQVDSSVQEVLHTVASQDDNPHIRTVSREVLEQLPQIQ